MISVNEYLAEVPKSKRLELERIRKLIKSLAPEVKERIAYKIVVFSLNRDLVGMAMQKNHYPHHFLKK